MSLFRVTEKIFKINLTTNKVKTMIINLASQQQKREKTELVLRNIYNLPPIPKVISETMTLLENKSTSTAELSKIISRDQGLVLKILAISNSPMYGLQRKVTSIDFALLILGFNELKNIISILSMTEAFRNKTDQYLDHKKIWMHSFLTGSAAKRLAEDLDFYNSGEAFIGGFLHDMGISVIHRYFHSNFIQITELVKNEGLTFREAELQVLGMDHQEISYFLLNRWNFPASLSDAIHNHHNPSLAHQDNKMLAAIIHFSDYMTKKLELGDFSYDSDFELEKESLGFMQFKDEAELEHFIEGYRDLFTRQIESVGYLN